MICGCMVFARTPAMAGDGPEGDTGWRCSRKRLGAHGRAVGVADSVRGPSQVALDDQGMRFGIRRMGGLGLVVVGARELSQTIGLGLCRKDGDIV
jgi:hypothetical protein